MPLLSELGTLSLVAQQSSDMLNVEMTIHPLTVRVLTQNLIEGVISTPGSTKRLGKTSHPQSHTPGSAWSLRRLGEKTVLPERLSGKSLPPLALLGPVVARLLFPLAITSADIRSVYLKIICILFEKGIKGLSSSSITKALTCR